MGEFVMRALLAPITEDGGRVTGYTDNTILALRAARGVVGVLPVPIPALSAALDAALEIAKLLKVCVWSAPASVH